MFMEKEMSRAIIQLIYEGPALRNHLMDVQELAPALMAMGDLCQEANRVLNRERTQVKVFINSDFERGSFLINCEVIQSLYELVNLIKDPRVMTAKELLEWLGIIGGLTGGYGLFKYLKIRRGRKIGLVEFTKSNKGENIVSIQCKGDNNTFCIPQRVYELGEDKNIIQACKGIVKPLKSLDIDCVKFKDKSGVQESVDKSDADAIIGTELESKEEEIVKPQIVDARLTVHTLSFDTKPIKWKFKYGSDVISVDVSETDIPEETIKRGYARVGDNYKAKLEITERKTETGGYVNDYKIIEVLEFAPGPPQLKLHYGDETTSS